MPGKQPSIYSSSYTTKQNCVSGNRKQLYTCFILASDQPLFAQERALYNTDAEMMEVERGDPPFVFAGLAWCPR